VRAYFHEIVWEFRVRILNSVVIHGIEKYSWTPEEMVEEPLQLPRLVHVSSAG
jgi:hypothetical protein